jgi:hypothetical protein
MNLKPFQELRELNQAFERVIEALKRKGDREDIYLQVLDPEAARENKGLPPRVTILPNWDSGDEERCDEAHARRREQAAQKAKRTATAAKFLGVAGLGERATMRPSKRRAGT